MTNFTLRPPSEADIPALVALLNAHHQAVQSTAHVTADEIRLSWSAPGFDPQEMVRVAETAEGTLIGSGSAFYPAPYVRGFVNAQVYPAHYDCGVGSALTEWAEAYLAAQIDKAPPDARITFNTGVIHTHERGARLLRDHGYTHVRSGYEMRISMSAAPPPPVWPAGISVRSMIPDQEEEAVYRADVEAFRDHWGFVEQPFEEDFPRWLHYTRNNPHYDPSCYWLAFAGDQIAGMALCVPQDNEEPDMAWVNTVAVLRPWRRRGLALALLQHAFGEFYRRGIYKVGLGVDTESLTGATKLYEKAGMQVYRQWDNYEKELRPGEDWMTREVHA
jgi:GNAT superfamily N-acetyltransferase